MPACSSTNWRLSLKLQQAGAATTPGLQAQLIRAPCTLCSTGAGPALSARQLQGFLLSQEPARQWLSLGKAGSIQCRLRRSPQTEPFNQALRLFPNIELSAADNFRV